MTPSGCRAAARHGLQAPKPSSQCLGIVNCGRLQRVELSVAHLLPGGLGRALEPGTWESCCMGQRVM